MASRGLLAELRERCDARVYALAVTSAFDAVPHRLRDSTFLGWKVDHAPADRSNYLVLTDRRTGALAWFACAPELGNRELLGVRDYDSVAPDGRVDRIWLGLLPVHARRCGAAEINVEMRVSVAAIAGWAEGGSRARDTRPIVMRTRVGTKLPESCHFTLVDQNG